MAVAAPQPGAINARRAVDLLGVARRGQAWPGPKEQLASQLAKFSIRAHNTKDLRENGRAGRPQMTGSSGRPAPLMRAGGAARL